MTKPRRQAEAPLYRQVKDYVVTRILAGDWPPGGRLPSEHQLTRKLGVSRMTAHRALRELTAEGWIARVQGAGSFVAEQKPQSALLEIRNIREEIAERGHAHACEVVKLVRERAGAEVAQALEVPRGRTVYHSILVNREDGVPVQVEDRYVNSAFAPDYHKQDFTRTTPYEYLDTLGPMDAAEHVIEVVLPDRPMQRMLQVEAGAPCLLLTRRTWSDRLVVSRARSTYPGARYRLAGRQVFANTRGSAP